MSLIVKTITRFTVGLVLVYGIFITLQGHVSPGGGFAGGIIITLAFIQLMLAFGQDEVLRKLNQEKGLLLAGIGAILFLVIASRIFLKPQQHSFVVEKHFQLLSAGFLSLSEIAIALMVAAGLFVIFLTLVLLIEEEEKEKK